MNEKLRKEITKALEILALNDRDLRTISIYCNPNNPHHLVSLGGYPNKIILNELETMEKENLIFQQSKKLNMGYGQGLKKFILWSLISRN